MSFVCPCLLKPYKAYYLHKNHFLSKHCKASVIDSLTEFFKFCHFALINPIWSELKEKENIWSDLFHIVETRQFSRCLVVIISHGWLQLVDKTNFLYLVIFRNNFQRQSVHCFSNITAILSLWHNATLIPMVLAEAGGRVENLIILC